VHTHFASATHLLATFLGVVIAGTFWRLFWMHTMAFGSKRGSRVLQGLSKAALAQF